ncbi:Uncharacterised protein [Legionella steigerwaltii]|uniref:Uncharacterized protein n=1 Tax=Legionella steigerwaltii TaxID=460 RepID=A0A378L956_9GAMM|nr:hypothetical protein [Legionella steigerwaltii]KTD80306.1 hypothetical protein Lstg_0568 [Legionella steigerwaltii]STY22388.1 Uncharacterised protein [Legionella steigerwaltii]
MKFPYVPVSELRRYFNQLSLPQLIEINRSYGPHFEQLDDRIDRCTNDLADANARLAQLNQRKHDHQQTYDAVEIREAVYQSTRRSVLADSSRTSRYLGMQAVGSSPMELFDSELLTINTEISKANNQIERLNDVIDNLGKAKTGAISELRILNSIMDEKKKEVLEETNTTQPRGL